MFPSWAYPRRDGAQLLPPPDWLRTDCGTDRDSYAVAQDQHRGHRGRSCPKPSRVPRASACLRVELAVQDAPTLVIIARSLTVTRGPMMRLRAVEKRPAKPCPA